MLCPLTDMLTLAAESAHHGPPKLLIDLLVILATAGLVAVVMQRLKLETVPAYLIAGAIIGPNALSFVSSPESTEAISSLAIILLMFGIGLHMDLSTLRLGLGAIIGATVIATALITAIAWPIGMMFGLSSPAAITVGMAFTLSSTAVVVRILGDRRLLRAPVGRLAFGILVAQDMLVIGMLALIPILAKWAGADPSTIVHATTEAGVDANTPATVALMEQESKSFRIVFEAAVRIGGIAMLIVLGKWLMPRLLAEAARGRSMEIMLVISTAAAIAAAGVTSWLGFSPEMGAFLAGLLLSSTQFRHQLSGQVGPLRDLFIAVFFTTVGMKLDPNALAGAWWIVLLGTGLLFAFKAVILSSAAWACGAAASTGIAAGFALAHAGEFSLVLLDAASTGGIFSKKVGATLTAIVAVSLMLIPLQVTLGQRLSMRFVNVPPPPWVKRPKFVDRLRHRLHLDRKKVTEESPQEDHHDVDDTLTHRRVILAGYGLVGRVVAEQLDQIGVSYTIVEMNPKTVEKQAKFKKDSVYGDISNPEVLEHAGLHDADAVIITIPDEEAVLRACAIVRKMAPKVFIAVRTSFFSKAMLATEAGADLVTVEEWATAQQMATEIAKHLGREAPKAVAPKAERLAEEAEIEEDSSPADHG